MVNVLGVRLSAFHMLSFFVNFITEIDKKKKKETNMFGKTEIFRVKREFSKR